MLSIIIVSYNTRDLLRQCLASLGRHTPAAQVIVVDNASPDNTVEVLREFGSKIRLIENRENVGFGRGCNQGFAAAKAKYAYFLNPDAMRVAVQSHTGHLKHPVCSALTTVQVMPNGDVLACYGMPPVGNIKTTPIREIWEKRPRWWREGCCLNERCTTAEKELLSISKVTAAAK